MMTVYEFLDKYPVIMGGVMCVIMLVFVILYAVYGKDTTKRLDEMKEALINKQIRINEQEKEIRRLKADLFAARCDRKFSEKKLNQRIEQLELDKKQMMKWGGEK